MLDKLEKMRPVILGAVIGLMISAGYGLISSIINPYIAPNFWDLLTLFVGFVVLFLETEDFRTSRNKSNTKEDSTSNRDT